MFGVQGFAAKREDLHDLQCLKVLKVGDAVPTSAYTAYTAYITLNKGFVTFMENRIIALKQRQPAENVGLDFLSTIYVATIICRHSRLQQGSVDGDDDEDMLMPYNDARLGRELLKLVEGIKESTDKDRTDEVGCLKFILSEELVVVTLVVIETSIMGT